MAFIDKSKFADYTEYNQREYAEVEKIKHLNKPLVSDIEEDFAMLVIATTATLTGGKALNNGWVVDLEGTEEVKYEVDDYIYIKTTNTLGSKTTTITTPGVVTSTLEVGAEIPENTESEVYLPLYHMIGLGVWDDLRYDLDRLLDSKIDDVSNVLEFVRKDGNDDIEVGATYSNGTVSTIFGNAFYSIRAAISGTINRILVNTTETSMHSPDGNSSIISRDDTQFTLGQRLRHGGNTDNVLNLYALVSDTGQSTTFVNQGGSTKLRCILRDGFTEGYVKVTMQTVGNGTCNNIKPYNPTVANAMYYNSFAVKGSGEIYTGFYGSGVNEFVTSMGGTTGTTVITTNEIRYNNAVGAGEPKLLISAKSARSSWETTSGDSYLHKDTAIECRSTIEGVDIMHGGSIAKQLYVEYYGFDISQAPLSSEELLTALLRGDITEELIEEEQGKATLNEVLKLKG